MKVKECSNCNKCLKKETNQACFGDSILYICSLNNIAKESSDFCDKWEISDILSNS